MKIMYNEKSKYKFLSGYVKDRTKEAAIGAVLLALSLVSRTFTVSVIPGIFTLDVAPAFVYAVATMLSLPYSIIFSFAMLYLGSNPIVFIAWLGGTVSAFFFTKLAGRKYAKHMSAPGELICGVVYIIGMHVAGNMDYRVLIPLMVVPEIVTILTVYFGGLMIWKAVERFDVLD